MKFLSCQVVLYLYRSTIHPCMEYYCHVMAGAPSCYLELLDKLQERICMSVGPSLAASLEPLAHLWNVASLKLVSAIFLSKFYFSPNESLSKTIIFFLFHQKSSFRSQDNQIFIIFSLNFYNFFFSSWHFSDSKGQMEVE